MNQPEPDEPAEEGATPQFGDGPLVETLVIRRADLPETLTPETFAALRDKALVRYWEFQTRSRK